MLVNSDRVISAKGEMLRLTRIAHASAVETLGGTSFFPAEAGFFTTGADSFTTRAYSSTTKYYRADSSTTEYYKADSSATEGYKADSTNIVAALRWIGSLCI